MKRFFSWKVPGAVALILVLAVATAAAVAAVPAVDALDSAGQVRLGDGPAKARAHLAWDADRQTLQDDPDACVYYSGGLLPQGVWMMVVKQHAVRFELDPDGHGAGPFGLRVGDAEAQALPRLPKGTQVLPNVYGEQGDHLLYWMTPGRDAAIQAVTTGGVVRAVTWGQPGAVKEVEGCE